MSHLKVVPTSSHFDWDLALKEANVHDVYFTHSYMSLLERNDEGTGILVVFRSPDGIVVCPLLIRQVPNYGQGNRYKDAASPYGYSGPVLRANAETDQPSLARDFRAAITEYYVKECLISEFVRFHPLLDNAGMLRDYMETSHVRETVYVDLSQPLQAIWLDSLTSKRRNLVRKAEKAGVEVRLRGEEGMGTFRCLYELTMNRLSAEDYYRFSDEYFTGLQCLMGSHGVILEARLDDRAIASMIVLYGGGYAHYHLSASDPNFRSIPATDSLLWAAIQWARSLGKSAFHLGGGYSGNDTLFHFKSGFSRLRAQFCVGRTILNPLVYSALVDLTGTSEAQYFPKYRCAMT